MLAIIDMKGAPGPSTRDAAGPRQADLRPSTVDWCPLATVIRTVSRFPSRRKCAFPGLVPGEGGRNETPTHEIAVAHLASRGTYGVPRIHAELRGLERCVNRKRCTLAMRGHGIRGGRGGAPRPKAE